MKPVLRRTAGGNWMCEGPLVSRVGGDPEGAYCEWAVCELERKLRRSWMHAADQRVAVTQYANCRMVRAAGGGRWAHGATRALALHALLEMV